MRGTIWETLAGQIKSSADPSLHHLVFTKHILMHLPDLEASRGHLNTQWLSPHAA